MLLLLGFQSVPVAVLSSAVQRDLSAHQTSSGLSFPAVLLCDFVEVLLTLGGSLLHLCQTFLQTIPSIRQFWDVGASRSNVRSVKAGNTFQT